MSRTNLSQHNLLIDNDLWELVVAESLNTNKSQSQIVREALAERYEKETYRPEKQLPVRIKNALSVFEILEILTEKDEDGTKYTQIWLSWADVLEVKYGRWAFAKKAISIFSKFCRELKHPVQFEQVITEIPIPGTSRKRMSKEGFNLFFEVPVTHGIIVDMKTKASDITDYDDFENILLKHPTDEIVKTRKDIAREMLQKASQAGGDDAEGFDTIE